MSSILTALKKIDETSRPAGNGQPWPQPRNAQATITEGIRKRWFLRRLTTYVLVAACLMTLGLLLYLRLVDRAAAPTKIAAGITPPVYRAKITQTAPPGDRIDSAVAQKGLTASQAIPPVKQPEPTIHRTAPLPVGKGARASRPAVRPTKPLPKRSKKAATKVAPPAAKGTGMTAGETAVAGRPVTASRSEPSPSYSRLQNADLILQAIAWSPEPAKRIAVINGSIVREGDTVGGYTLTRIRPDDIVLNDGSKSWQLDFGLQN